MTIGQFIRVLRARWVSALVVLLGVVGLVATASYLWPKSYTATSSVLIDVRNPDPIAGLVMQAQMAGGYMATQIDVVQSERVALHALRALGLDKSEELRAKWQEKTGGAGDFAAWVADFLQEDLEVRPSRESNVLVIAYTSPVPEFSAAVANQFMRSFMEISTDLRVEPAGRYNDFFDARAKQLRDNLERAQSRLSAYQREHGIVATDERLDIEGARLTELSSQLVALQAVAAETTGRQGILGGEGADKLPEVLSNPVITALTSDLLRQQAALKEASQRLGDAHPQLQQLRASIAELRARIDAETKRVSSSVRVTNDVNQSRLAQLRAAINEQRQKLLRMRGQRDEAAVLLSDVTNAKTAYDAVFQRVVQSGMESQNTQTNLSVLKQATVPPLPSSPRPLLNTAIALVLGSLIAMGVALMRELNDRRMRSEEDVVEGLKQPVLVRLPLPERRGKRSQSARLRFQQARTVYPGLAGPTS